MERLSVRSPNHSTPSCTIRHWKLYVPCVVGAVMVKGMVTCGPGGTDWGGGARFLPHVKLSCGFCEPSEKLLPAPQVVSPVFSMVTATFVGWPGAINKGADWEIK